VLLIGAIVGAGVLCDVKVTVVPVDRKGKLRNVPVVNPESSGSDALGVLPEVLVPFLETVGEEDFPAPPSGRRNRS
jgi:hypothetical protein